MKEYCKIANVFNFNSKGEIEDLNDTCNVLNGIIWQGTEKIDGTNIRVHWDGHNIEFAGRTDKSQIPNELQQSLNTLFLTPEMEYLFEQIFNDKDVILYGEGYGPKIQNGGNYSQETKFILFDVEIDDSYLSRENVIDIANKLGLETVPVVYEGDIDKAILFVAAHHMSTLGDHTHEMEGIVLQPKGIILYNDKKKPLKFKCKYRDVKRIKNYGK